MITSKHTLKGNDNNKVLTLILILLFFQSEISNASTSKVLPGKDDYESNIKVNDYATYSLTTEVYHKKGDDGNYSHLPSFFPQERTITFNWTIIGINTIYYVVNFTIDVPGFYHDVRRIYISDRIGYNEDFKSIGYFPLWTPLSTLIQHPELNISIDGPIDHPISGKIKFTDDHDYYLGGVHESITLSNPENYFEPNVISGLTIGGYAWTFNRENGLLVKLWSPLIWYNLNFTYGFGSGFEISATNINIGQSDVVYNILYLLAPYMFIIFIAVDIIVIIVIIKFAQFLKRHSSK